MINGYDAVVVGSGPNGLSAAICLARAGRRVVVLEAAASIGGSCRSAELTLPGFRHDVCAAVQAFAQLSPFFSSIPLHEHGLFLVRPASAVAHPFDDGAAVVLGSGISQTAEQLGRDGEAYKRLLVPFVIEARSLFAGILGPPRLPSRPLLLARFGIRGLQSASRLARRNFSGVRARALFAGLAAHSMVPLEYKATAAFGLVLAIAAHAGGWPLAQGGSQSVVNALASYLRSLGGEIIVGRPVKTLKEVRPARLILCDLTPKQFLSLALSELPPSYRRRLEKYRYGPGAFKIDWALNGPIPWKASECSSAGTVHIGGSLEEIAESERRAWQGQLSERPYILLVQPTLFDPLRAPAGKHIGWGYCHVPNGSTFDMTERMEKQIERFAPGFRDLILARKISGPRELESWNMNLVGGDINGGAQDLGQLFARPVFTFKPYSTPIAGVYLCSSSTPPGGGVHGMCGYFAAAAAIKESSG